MMMIFNPKKSSNDFFDYSYPVFHYKINVGVLNILLGADLAFKGGSVGIQPV